MAPFEYLLLFAVIVLAIAVTDLSVSLHRLLAAGRRVRWHWLAPLAAFVAFEKIVTQWWTWHGGESFARGLTFEMFLGLLAVAVLLFLLAAAALPDEVASDEPIDLEAHYTTVSRRYWILFFAHFALGTTLSTWAQVRIAGAHYDPAQPAYLVGPLALSLIVWRNRWWHTLCLVGLTVLYLAQFFGQTLA